MADSDFSMDQLVNNLPAQKAPLAGQAQNLTGSTETTAPNPPSPPAVTGIPPIAAEQEPSAAAALPVSGTQKVQDAFLKQKGTEDAETGPSPRLNVTPPNTTKMFTPNPTAQQQPGSGGWDALTKSTGIITPKNIGAVVNQGLGTMATAAKGINTGISSFNDQVYGAAQVPYQLYAQATGQQPPKPWQSMEALGDQLASPEEQKSPAYAVGKFGGELGMYGLVSSETKLPIWGAAAEGGAIGLGSSAARQLKDTAKIDPNQLMGDTIVGAGLGTAGGVGGKLIGKLAAGRGGKAAKEAAEAITPPAAVKPGELPAEFRNINLGKKGYEQIQGGKEFHQIAAALTEAEQETLKGAIIELAKAKALVVHTANELRVAGHNGLRFAQSEAEKMLLGARLGEGEPTSKGQAYLDEIRSGLHLAQTEAEKQQLLARKAAIEDALKRATQGSREALQASLDTIEEGLRKANTPAELVDMSRGKSLETLINRHQLYAEKHTVPKLATTFEGAVKQVKQLSKELSALEDQYKALKEHLLATFEDAEKKIQAHFNTPKERLSIKFKVPHPHMPDVLADAAVSLRKNSAVADLYGMYQKEFQAAREEIKKQTDLWAKPQPEFKFRVDKFDKTKLLKEKGYLSPLAAKLMLAAVVGAPALDLSASATDPNNDDTHKPQLGKLIAATLAALLIGNYAYPQLRRALTRKAGNEVMKEGIRFADHIVRDATWIGTRLCTFTSDINAMADSLMGRVGEDSLAGRISLTGGKLMWTQVLSKLAGETDPGKTMDAIFHKIPIEELNPIAQEHVLQARVEVSELKHFVKGYVADWDDFYRDMPKKQQQFNDAIHHTIHFVDDVLNNYDVLSPIEKVASGTMANAMKAMFSTNPSQWIAQATHLAATGPMTMGSKHIMGIFRTYHALLGYLSDGSTRKLLDSTLHVGGSDMQVVNELQTTVKKQFKMPLEEINAKAGALASLMDYYDKNPHLKMSAKYTSGYDFARKWLTGNVSTEDGIQASVKMYTDLATTLGHDPLNLQRDPMGRSKYLNYIAKLFRTHARVSILATQAATRGARNYIAEAQAKKTPVIISRLVTNYVAKGDWLGLTAFLGLTYLVAGEGVLPASWKTMGWVIDPEFMAKFTGFLNQHSAGVQIWGTMGEKMSWDPLAWPMIAVTGIGLQQLHDKWSDLDHISNRMSKLFGDVTTDLSNAATGKPLEGGAAEKLTGSKFVKENLEAQKTAKTALDLLSLLLPTIRGISTQRLGSFGFNFISYLNGEYYGGVKKPGFIQAGNLEPSKVSAGDQSKAESLNAAIGLKETPKRDMYEKARQAQILSKKKGGLTPEGEEAFNNWRDLSGF